jgi:NADH-quinone oxidoreductase subunit M
MLFAMASAGLPGLNNFIGEFLILAGSYQVAQTATILAFLGLILSLIYTVRLVQELLFQEEREVLTIADSTSRETLMLSILALGVIFIGLHPGPLLDMLVVPVDFLMGGAP